MGVGDQKPSKHFPDSNNILASQPHCSKSQAITQLYGRLSITLVRANARALLARCGRYNGGPGDEFLVYM